MRVTGNHLEVRLVTFNLLQHQPSSNPRDDLHWVISNWHPDVIGTQEAQEYHAMLHSIAGYGYALKPGMGHELPILYNKDTMRLISVTTHILTFWSAPHFNPRRYLVAAHFVTKTDGRHVWYFNTHANHLIEIHGPGGSTGRPHSGPQTVSAEHGFRRMANLIQDVGRKKGNAVFWGGDLNVDERADNRFDWKGFPNQIFREHDMWSVFDELHKIPAGRTIDIIGSCKEDEGVKALRYLRGPAGLHSDHRPTAADYQIPRDKQSAGATKPKDPKDKTKLPTLPDPKNPYYPLPDEDFEFNIPIPDPAVPLPPILVQPQGTWDHSVCCRK